LGIQEITGSCFKVINRLGKDKKKEQIEATRYIELLASQTGTRIESWDILKLFSAGKGKVLIVDKTEINQRFFSQLEAIKVTTLTEVSVLDSETFKKIDEVSKGRVKVGKKNSNSIEALKKRQASYLQMIEKYLLRANQYTEKASNLEKQLNVLESKRTNYASQINELLKENFWEFRRLNDRTVELVTRTDIILRHRNPAAGVNLSVNMGRYLVQLDLFWNTVSVWPYKDNVLVNGYPHPHITSGGSICWGNASSVIAKAMPRGDLLTVFRLLASILTSYNDGSPYVSLEHFAAKSTRR
jgi:hypothetical protein